MRGTGNGRKKSGRNAGSGIRVNGRPVIPVFFAAAAKLKAIGVKKHFSHRNGNRTTAAKAATNIEKGMKNGNMGFGIVHKKSGTGGIGMAIEKRAEFNGNVGIDGVESG